MIPGLLGLLIYFISLSPWFKYMCRWSPFVLLLLATFWIILTNTPSSAHSLVDYLKPFIALVVFSGILAFLVLLPRLLRRKLLKQDGTEDIIFRLGQIDFPPGTEAEVKTVVDFQIWGVSVQILSTGKFWKFTLSTDSP